MSLLSCKIYNEMHMMKSNKKSVLREENYKIRQTSISWGLSNNRVQIYNPRKTSIYDSLRSSSNSSISSIESNAETVKHVHSSFVYNPKTNKYIEYETDDDGYNGDEENIIDGSSNIIILENDGHDPYYYNPIDESYI